MIAAVLFPWTGRQASFGSLLCTKHVLVPDSVPPKPPVIPVFVSSLLPVDDSNYSITGRYLATAAANHPEIESACGLGHGSLVTL